MIKNDQWIRSMSKNIEVLDSSIRPPKPIIRPFYERTEGDGKISYGLSSNGYDLLLGTEFLLFTDIRTTMVDPKDFDRKSVDQIETGLSGKESFILPPHSYCLATSIEYIYIPRNIMAMCVGKSTYARSGIIVNTTPLEPEWEGHLTIEISNSNRCPAKLYPLEGIAQLLFFDAEPCQESYADKKGKYQAQVGVTPPKVKDIS